MSSGSSSFISSVMVLAVLAGGSVYAIKHRDEVVKYAAEFVHAPATPAAQTTADEDQEGRPKSRDFSEIEIAANAAGHFESEVEVNGSRMNVLIDTGATFVAMTYDDARRAGVFLQSSDFTQEVQTANGTAKIAPVTLDTVTLGDITVHNVQGAVAERGRLHKTLLGMSFLSRLSGVEMRSSSLVLHK